MIQTVVDAHATQYEVLRRTVALETEREIQACSVWVGSHRGALPCLVLQYFIPRTEEPLLAGAPNVESSCETGTFAQKGRLPAIAATRLRAESPESPHASMMRAHTRTV